MTSFCPAVNIVQDIFTLEIDISEQNKRGSFQTRVLNAASDLARKCSSRPLKSRFSKVVNYHFRDVNK